MFPEEEHSASELARLAETSLPTVLREIDRLVPMGFLNERTVGRNRLIRANTEHQLFRPVEQIVRYAYGPFSLLPRVLAGIEGIIEVYVYGSWVARLNGEVGHDPVDVDVLVVGDADRTLLYEAATSASNLLGREVNIRQVSPKAWSDGTDLFVRTIQQRPLARIGFEEAS